MQLLPVFSTTYLGPVEYFKNLLRFKNVAIESNEFFQKQTIRNRCFILSPNGIQCLTIPLQHANGKKQLISDIKISYDSSWQRLHWRSLVTAYNRSPYFEYFADDFARFYEDAKYKWLLDFNNDQLSWLLKSIKIASEIEKTTVYSNEVSEDFRMLSNAKTPDATRIVNFKTYNQVFSYKFGFTRNLSIIDLLFNVGGISADFLIEPLN